MRTLITVVIAALSLNAFGQGILQLPYNPDENGDGLIGVVDLQGLLSNYGNEFDTAVLSEDGESAIVYVGDIAYPFCSKTCSELPGIWSVANIEDLALVWDEVYSANEDRLTWLKREYQNISVNGLPVFPFFSSDDVPTVPGNWSLHKIDVTPFPQSLGHCYCAARQLPRIEYSYCASSQSIQDCCDAKVSEGWLPLGGISVANYINSPYQQWSQAFWRWAE